MLSQATRVTVRSGEPLRDDSGLWFPEGAVLSFCETVDDRAIECGLVGFEGVIGWDRLLGLPESGECVDVMIGGPALRVPTAAMAALCRERPSLIAHLLRFREAIIVQLRTTIATRLHEGPDRRLARWLCMLHDRIEGDTLDITHLRLAKFLDARRASVTDSLHVLEGERVVRCTRGKILIRNRAALEAAAGQGYGRAEKAFAALVGTASGGR